LHGTNLADAIVVARDALVADPTHPPADRDLAIVLLSDGEPTLPVFPRADRAAVDAAAVAGLMGIALHGFAIGAKGAAALPLLREFASLSGGRAEHIERPAEAIARLRRLDLARVSSVEIRNESTASDAVALRVFPDGSFDAIVPLAVGTNHIAVRARDESGREALAQRTVNREAGTPDEADERRAAELLEELKRRTVQMELWAEMEQRRRIQRRDLEIVPIPPDRDPPDGSEAP
jgi:hypothetical protein